MRSSYSLFIVYTHCNADIQSHHTHHYRVAAPSVLGPPTIKSHEVNDLKARLDACSDRRVYTDWLADKLSENKPLIGTGKLLASVSRKSAEKYLVL